MAQRLATQHPAKRIACLGCGNFAGPPRKGSALTSRAGLRPPPPLPGLRLRLCRAPPSPHGRPPRRPHPTPRHTHHHPSLTCPRHRPPDHTCPLPTCRLHHLPRPHHPALHSATHRSEALWPGCRHPYRLACLARTRARMPNPVCALCRQPWPPHEDSALSLACNTVGINPYQDSEAELPPAPPSNPCPNPAPPHLPDASAPPPHHPLPAPTWRTRPPPAGVVHTPANSWLYVPLLLGAAQELAPDTLAQWQSTCGPWWEAARRALADADPIPLPEIAAALDITPASGAAALCDRLRAAAAPLPASTRVHLGWVVRTFSDADGYIPAAGQEISLQLYGGLGLAADLDRRSHTFRAGAPYEPPALAHPYPPPSPRPSPPTPPAPRTPAPVGSARTADRPLAEAAAVAGEGGPGQNDPLPLRPQPSPPGRPPPPRPLPSRPPIPPFRPWTPSTSPPPCASVSSPFRHHPGGWPQR